MIIGSLIQNISLKLAGRMFLIQTIIIAIKTTLSEWILTCLAGKNYIIQSFQTPEWIQQKHCVLPCFTTTNKLNIKGWWSISVDQTQLFYVKSVENAELESRQLRLHIPDWHNLLADKCKSRPQQCNLISSVNFDRKWPKKTDLRRNIFQSLTVKYFHDHHVSTVQ